MSVWPWSLVFVVGLHLLTSSMYAQMISKFFKTTYPH